MARRGRGRRTKEMVQIARERIDILMREADQAALTGNIEHADRYVDLARRVGMRYNVRVPAAYRRRFCRGCYRYLQPGVSSRTRLSRGKVVTTCLNCGHVSRIPLGHRANPKGDPPSAETRQPPDEE